MSRPYTLVYFSVVAISGILVLVGLSHTGATIGDQYFLVITIGVTSLVVLVALIVFIFAHIAKYRFLRNCAVLVCLCAVVVMGVPWYVSSYRVKHTRQTLESVYAMIASHGTPFPQPNQVEEQFFSDNPSLISHGYWVSPDRKSFEVFYHQSSNSFVMQFPDKEWKWRGFNYQGPTIAILEQ